MSVCLAACMLGMRKNAEKTTSVRLPGNGRQCIGRKSGTMGRLASNVKSTGPPRLYFALIDLKYLRQFQAEHFIKGRLRDGSNGSFKSEEDWVASGNGLMASVTLNSKFRGRDRGLRPDRERIPQNALSGGIIRGGRRRG